MQLEALHEQTQLRFIAFIIQFIGHRLSALVNFVAGTFQMGKHTQRKFMQATSGEVTIFFFSGMVSPKRLPVLNTPRDDYFVRHGERR